MPSGSDNFDQLLSNAISANQFSNSSGNSNNIDSNDFNFGDFSDILSGVGSLYGAYGGMKALDLGKEQFNFSRDLALTNLHNQANLTNAELTDRQNRRNRNAVNNGGTPLSTADYIAQFGVTGNLGGNDTPAPVNNTATNRPARTVSAPNEFNFGR